MFSLSRLQKTRIIPGYFCTNQILETSAYAKQIGIIRFPKILVGREAKEGVIIVPTGSQLMN